MSKTQPYAPVAISGLTTTSSVAASATFARVRASTVRARSHFIGSLPAVLGEHYGELASIHFVPVKVIQRIHGIAAIIELHKGKSAGTLGVVILSNQFESYVYSRDIRGETPSFVTCGMYTSRISPYRVKTLLISSAVTR
jgi:hypothetical protein